MNVIKKWNELTRNEKVQRTLELAGECDDLAQDAANELADHERDAARIRAHALRIQNGETDEVYPL
jgi:hypothetical protein